MKTNKPGATQLAGDVKYDTALFCDLKTDEEKSTFFLSGRGYETGVIAQAIQNDVAMAYHRCSEYRKELEALRDECGKLRKDAERIEWLEDQTKKSRTGISFDYHRYVEDGYVVDHGYRFMRRHFVSGFKDSLRKAIDAAMQETSHDD